MDTNYVSSYEMKAAQATLLKNVYLWMTVALAITGITALARSKLSDIVIFAFQR